MAEESKLDISISASGRDDRTEEEILSDEICKDNLEAAMTMIAAFEQCLEGILNEADDIIDTIVPGADLRETQVRDSIMYSSARLDILRDKAISSLNECDQKYGFPL